MGFHVVNRELFDDPAIDELRPEALLYMPKPGGGMRLVGVEYLRPVVIGGDWWWGPAAPGPAAGSTPSVLGQLFQGPMPGHDPWMPWHWDLHVWAWATNPNGTFAQWNPSLSCTP